MEVCSSTEMGAPGASHLGTGDRGPKTDRSRPLSVSVNADADGDLGQHPDHDIPVAMPTSQDLC